jgi:hypothetical protein
MKLCSVVLELLYADRERDVEAKKCIPASFHYEDAKNGLCLLSWSVYKVIWMRCFFI